MVGISYILTVTMGLCANTGSTFGAEKEKDNPITCLKFSIVLREKQNNIGMRERKIT